MMFGCCTLDKMFISLRMRTKSSSFLILTFSKILIAIFSPDVTWIASFTLPNDPLPRVLRMTYFF